MLRRQTFFVYVIFCFFCLFFTVSSGGIVSINYNVPLAHCFHCCLVGAQQRVLVSHQAFRDGFPAACVVLVSQQDAISSSWYFICHPIPSKWKYQLLIQGWISVGDSCSQNVSGICSFCVLPSPIANVPRIGKELFTNVFSPAQCLWIVFGQSNNLATSVTRKMVAYFYFFICL